ncbi:MAG: hypothetical protein NTZ90_15365 [Proteobacteria bacterium]|nr:hypothetical protein [Pseudomonadota bacterium]
MHVIWKRPDGFHGANPTDFIVVAVGTRANIWLHKSDTSHFPFRIAGGWQESESTKRLNNLVNMLGREDKAWVDALLRIFDDTMGDEPARFVDDLARWVTDLCQHLKGDTWEVDIMNHTLSEVAARLGGVREAFLRAAPRLES